MSTTDDELAYDEFGLFHENAQEWGLPFDGPPVVRRERVEVAPGRSLSALVWGSSAPQVVFLHGGAQNAHTWDTVAMALGLPLVAVDLPGHGHSDPLPDTPFSPRDFAGVVEIVVRALAPDARAVVGMSLGGLTSIALAARAPDLVRKLVLVDVLPSINTERAAPIGEFVNGPESFATFDEILARTIQFNPTRSESSLRRGVLHNSVRRDDGSWVWRHQMHWQLEQSTRAEREAAAVPEFGTLWDDLAGVGVPVLLAYGTTASSVVDDAALAELEERRPGTRVVAVDGAGHSIQGDRPVVLAQLVGEFLDADA
jgi:pimeloyl-ACP methyl ester carboxylesterase